MSLSVCIYTSYFTTYELLKICGIFTGSSLFPPRRRLRQSSDPLPNGTCGVCFDELTDLDELPRTRCKHNFCRECWSGYLTSSIKSDGQCSIRCMSDQCKALLPEEFMKSVLDVELYKRCVPSLCFFSRSLYLIAIKLADSSGTIIRLSYLVASLLPISSMLRNSAMLDRRVKHSRLRTDCEMLQKPFILFQMRA